MEFEDIVVDEDYEQEAKIIMEMINYAMQGNQIRILGKGNSMRPLLRDGKDYAILERIVNKQDLKRGDIVFYYSHGHFVLHRIFQRMNDGARMLGDGNNLVEDTVLWKHIYLKAVALERDGKQISLERWYLRLYGFVWMGIRPLRGWIRRGIRWCKRSVGR